MLYLFCYKSYELNITIYIIEQQEIYVVNVIRYGGTSLIINIPLKNVSNMHVLVKN